MRTGRRAACLWMMCGLALLLAMACSDDPPDSATGTAQSPTGTSSATPTEDPAEALTPEESEWLATATAVGPGFVRGALEAIARDRDDEQGLFAVTEAEGGPIEDSVPAEAPGRFASAHAALLAAREDLVAFRDAGISRAETGTEYDALLAGYEQAIVGWALLVGVDLPE